MVPFCTPFIAAITGVMLASTIAIAATCSTQLGIQKIIAFIIDAETPGVVIISVKCNDV